MDKFIQIDEEGFLHYEQKKIIDQKLGHSLLENLEVKPLQAFFTTHNNEKIIVEALDAPLVVNTVAPLKEKTWVAETNYGYSFQFSIESLRLDEWDRFLGYDSLGRPFVLNNKCQSLFFDKLDGFDDDGITYNGTYFPVDPWLSSQVSTAAPDFWDKKYIENEIPGWELNKASPPLVAALPQLKIPKCRVLVPGCGSGNDAAYLAEQGHIVTAIDYSSEAIQRAQKKYSHIKNLNFEQLDIFNLPDKYIQAFDLICEHTLFCAVPFEKRSELVKIWKKCLVEKGHLLAILFVMEQKEHPPFGGSEWEYQQRLKGHFKNLYWTRWKESEGWRQGTELLIYAEKKENL